MNNKFFNIFLFLTFLFEQSLSTLVVSKNKFDTIFEFDSDLESNSAAFDEFLSSNKKSFNKILKNNSKKKVEFLFNEKNKNSDSGNSENDSQSTDDEFSSNNKKSFNEILKNNSKKKVKFLFNEKNKNNDSDNSGNDSQSTDDESDLAKGYGLSSGGGQRKAIEDKNGNFFDENGNQINLNLSYIFCQNEKLKEQEQIKLELENLDREIKILKEELDINNKNKFHNNSDHNNGISDNKTLIGGFSKNEIKENLKIIYKKKEMQNKKLFNKEYYQELKGDKVSKYRKEERKQNKENKIKKITEEDYNKKFNNEKIEEKNKFKKISFNEVVKVQNFKLDREERKLNLNDFQIIKNRNNEFRYKIGTKDNNSFYYDLIISNKENKIYLIRKIYYKDYRNSKVNDEVVWIGEENYSKEKFLGKEFIDEDAIKAFILKKENENELERKWEEILKKNKNNFK